MTRNLKNKYRNVNEKGNINGDKVYGNEDKWK